MSDTLHQPNQDLESPWQNKEILEELYVEGGLTQAEVADELGCSSSTVNTWLKKHRLSGDLPDTDPDKYGEEPWKDRELMERLYIEEKKSSKDISILFDCSNATISEWLDRHSIEKRSLSESQSASLGLLNHASFLTREFGHEVWQHDMNTVLVHRLLAVSKFGFDDLYGKVVHHKNHIPWDNRPSNIELMKHGEHSSHHKKIRGEKRKEIADVYENTDRSSRDVGEEYGVAGGTVLRIHEEYYGDSHD